MWILGVFQAAEGGDWGWYNLEQLPDVVSWLESGCSAEGDLAEEVYSIYESWQNLPQVGDCGLLEKC